MKFKKQLMEYLDTFKLNRKFLYIFSLDTGFWIVVWLFFFFLTGILNRQVEAISGGKSVSQLRDLILSSSPEQLHALTAQLKIFMASIIGGAVVYALLFLALYSLSRFLIWNLLLDKKFNIKKYPKWNLLSIVVGILLLLTIVVYYVVLFPILLLQTSVLEQILIILFLVGFLFLVSVIYANFAKTNKVWTSIGKAFEDIKVHFKTIAVSYGLAILTLIALGLVLFLLMKFIVPYEFSLYLIILGLLAFLAWLRLYVVEVLA